MKKYIKSGYEFVDGTYVEVYSDYYKAKRRAEELGLSEAEYGDIHNTPYSYVYYNHSGNRNDDEEVIAYYKFVNGKPSRLNDEEKEDIVRRYEIESFDD